MKVNERRTVVGVVDWPLCVPPNRGERSTRMDKLKDSEIKKLRQL